MNWEVRRPAPFQSGDGDVVTEECPVGMADPLPFFQRGTPRSARSDGTEGRTIIGNLPGNGQTLSSDGHDETAVGGGIIMRTRKKHTVRGAMALLAVMLMLSAPVLMVSESEAAGTGSLVTGADGDGNPVYTVKVSAGQLFTYPGVRTPLDGLDDIGYTWSGDASDPSGSDGLAWDPQTHTLEGTFSTPGKRVGTLVVQATDGDGERVTSSLRFAFEIASTLDLGDSVAVSASVGDPAGKEVHSIGLPTGTVYGVRTEWSGDAPFTVENKDDKVSVRTSKQLTSADSGTYTLHVRITDPVTAYVTVQEIVISVYEGIVFDNTCLHLFAEGDGHGLPASFRFDYTLQGDVAVTSSNIIVSDNGPLSVYDDRVAIDRASLGGPGEHTAELVLTLSNGVTATSVFRLTVTEPIEQSTTVRPLSANSDTAILTVDCEGAESVTVDWGDAIWSSSESNVDGVFNLSHPYGKQGMFLITVQKTVGDRVLTDRVMFGSGVDPFEPAHRYDAGSSDEDDDRDGWGWLVLAVMAVVLVLVFLFVYPVLPVILAATVCAVLAVVGYLF